MDEESIVLQLQRAREGGVAMRVYRKAIVGKVCVKLLDQYTGKQVEVLLTGEPGKALMEDIEVSLYTKMEVNYFERQNRGLIERGSLILVSEEGNTPVRMENAISDEQITELLTGTYTVLAAAIKKISSVTTLNRILKVAEDLNRLIKTINLIKSQIEKVQ